jgi:hypothetical protein
MFARWIISFRKACLKRAERKLRHAEAELDVLLSRHCPLDGDAMMAIEETIAKLQKRRDALRRSV